MQNIMADNDHENMQHGWLHAFKEPGSAITHLIGAVAAAIAAPFLIRQYIRCGASASELAGAVIFILSMFLLYSASTIYHSVRSTPDREMILKKMDHMMIFVLIAGSYTPFCLTVLKPHGGMLMLAGIWGLAAAGMIFKYCWVTCPKWVSSVIYIGMGWFCIPIIPALLSDLPHAAFGLLLAGGLTYTIGGVIYALKLEVFNHLHPNFGSHEVFHLFIMGGSLLQFLVVYSYLV